MQSKPSRSQHIGALVIDKMLIVWTLIPIHHRLSWSRTQVICHCANCAIA